MLELSAPVLESDLLISTAGGGGAGVGAGVGGSSSLAPRRAEIKFHIGENLKII